MSFRKNSKTVLTFLVALFVLSAGFLLLPKTAVMSYSFISNDTEHYIEISGEGSSGNPIGFKDIVDYFETNPISDDLQIPSSGDLCENNSVAWSSSSGDITTPVDENSITQVGSYSIKATKNGSGQADLEWTAENSTTFSDYFDANCANKVIFWVRTDNANIELDSLVVWKYYNDSLRKIYPTEFRNTDNNGWTFPANTWTKVEIDIRNDFYSRQTTREWWSSVSSFVFSFSGGVSGDNIYIDGLRTELDKPNPTNVYPNLYTFPMSIKMDTSYFSDDEFNAVFNSLISSSFEANNCSQFDLGSEGRGGTIIANGFSSYTKPSSLVINPGHNTANIIGITSSGGVNIGTDYSDSLVLFKNCNFYSGSNLVSSMNYEDTIIHENTTIGDTGGLFMGGSYMPTLNILNSNAKDTIYSMWQMNGDFKGAKFTADSGRIIYIRGIRDRDETFNLINPDFSEAGDDTYARLMAYSLPPYGGVGNTYRTNVQFSIDIKVLNSDGSSIENANVVLIDKNSNEAFNVNTTSNGTISTQNVTSRYLEMETVDESATYINWDPKGVSTTFTNHGISLNPFTLTISHQDYPSREFEFTLDEKKDWTIALKDRPISVGSVKVWGTEYADDEAGTIYAQVTYGDGSPCNTIATADITATVYKS
ncbi:MAG: hypothetical protein U9R00_02205, partial [Patescibacteria group bacterium]|nr:hypothetical protein [Patescibacteria group bacterium]